MVLPVVPLHRNQSQTLTKKVMKTEITEVKVRFTVEHIKLFNRETIENSLDTQDRLYVVSFNRVNELKSDICRYILSILDDKTYFIWDQAAINARLHRLSEMGCEEAIDKFFEYGYWT